MSSNPNPHLAFYWRAFRLIPVIILLIFGLEIITRVVFFGPSALWHLWDYNNRSLLFSAAVKPVEDKNICWELIPNYQGYFRNTRFTTNQYGFRELDFEVRKKSGITRIAVLGRSTSMGTGVEDDELYSRQLQKILNENYPQQFEVLNFAVGAYRFPQMQAAYEMYVKKFKPDIVIWPIYYGEINKSIRGCPSLASVQPEWNELRGYFLDSFLYRAGQAWLKKTFSWRTNDDWQTRGRPVTPPRKTRGALLSEFIRARHAENVQVIVVSLFNIMKIEEQTEQKSRQEIQDWLDSLQKNYPITWIDTVPELVPLVSEDDLTYLGDSHPNARVHRLYAESIFKQINWDKIEK